MKRLISLVIMLWLGNIAFAQEETLSAIFTNRFDLTQPSMSEVKKLVTANKLQEAIDLWRDTVVNRFRRIDFDQFSWHSYKTHPRQTSWASYLLGYTTKADYLAQTIGVDYYDYFNLEGKPGASPTPNWTAKPGTGETNSGAGTYLMFIPLASKYYLDYKTEYMDKWFEITNDFANNSRTKIMAIDDVTQKAMNPGYTTGAQDVLDQGGRLKNIIRCIAVFTKNLPGETKVSSWDKVISEKRTSVSRTMSQNIPSKDLINIVVHLFRDNPDILLSVYRNAGKVPNQRFNGLVGMYMTQVLFPEIKDPSNYRTETHAGLQDFLNTMYYKDGAMLEQSFNYNTGDAGEIDAAIALLKSANVTDAMITSDYSTTSKNFWRMLSALKNPLLTEPIVGNLGHSGANNVWKDATTATTWINSKISATNADVLDNQIYNSFKNIIGTKPLFTSVSMPYAGYHALRNSWTINSAFLFMNTARPARGHACADYNGIQVYAFGRELLIGSGQPDYYGSLESGISGYVSESSSFKMNTVVVDGLSETRQPILQTVASSTIKNKTYFSNNIDYIEGNYTMGYATTGATTATIKNVSHHREVSFIKDAGFWIVTDEMTNSGTSSHTYTQTWNFPPYSTTDKAYGFTEAQVLTDNTKRSIYTADPTGPNIILKHVGKTTITYNKYYGNKSPYYGWYAPGISTAIADVDIHASFTGTGNQMVGTVIIPSKNQTFSPVITDLSTDSKTINMKINIADTNEITFLKSFNVIANTCYDFNFNSKGFLLKRLSNGDVQGYVVNCSDKQIIWKGNVIKHSFTDFSVNYNALKKEITLISFMLPDTFRWTNAPAPVYQKVVPAPVVWALPKQPAQQIPGIIEAEEFDTGGEGFAYHDADTINKGGAYRMSEGVDIQTTTDVGGGYNIGYVVNGEWVLYTVDVASTNNYNVCIRAASLSTGGELHIEIDNINISGAITIPATGGWQTYTDVCALINLTKGQHTMKVVFDKGNININKYEFSDVLITDVKDNAFESEFRLYPNPAKDQLIIKVQRHKDIVQQCSQQASAKSEIQIINTLGQVVYSNSIQNINQDYSIDVSALSKGIYFVTYAKRTQKLIIK